MPSQLEALEQPGYLHAFRHRIPLQVRFSDVDRLGHVNNSVYQQFYDLGRLHYFQSVLEGPMEWEGDVVVLAHLEVDYLHPVTLEHQLHVGTRTLFVGTRSFRMEQVIFDTEAQRIYSRAISVMVGFNGQRQQSADLRPEWLKAMQAYDAMLG